MNRKKTFTDCDGSIPGSYVSNDSRFAFPGFDQEHRLPGGQRILDGVDGSLAGLLAIPDGQQRITGIDDLLIAFQRCAKMVASIIRKEDGHGNIH